MPIDPKFLDLINYGICYVLNEKYGKEETEKVFKEVGKVLYTRIKGKGLISPAKDPMDTLVEIARFLEKMGYMEKIDITRRGDKELELDMHGVSVLDSSVKLVESGRSPSHYMTNIMFAALQDCGIDAELIDLGFDLKGNHVKEKWILK